MVLCFMKKIENYLKAVQRLDEANIEYRKHPDNDVIRDGLIQRFEFTFELAWKASKEYLIDQGFSNDLHFPKQVLPENSQLQKQHLAYL